MKPKIKDPITGKRAIEIIKIACSMLGPKFLSYQATKLMLAIGWQESRFIYKHQVKGPAHGYWQFESGGGVKGVMHHHLTKGYAKQITHLMQIPWNRQTIFEDIDDDEVLAAVFARLLLWTDPEPLPKTEEQAWEYYIRNWRPGKPHLKTWHKAWEFANKSLEEYGFNKPS